MLKDKISWSSTLELMARTGLIMKMWKDRVKGGTISTASSTHSTPSRELKMRTIKEVICSFNNIISGPPGCNCEAPSSSRQWDDSNVQSSELILTQDFLIRQQGSSLQQGMSSRVALIALINHVYHNRKVLAVLYTWQQGM
jgi:hypothetical protein